jgi:hypothetical protein
VYAFLIDGGVTILQATDYIEHSANPLWTEIGCDHLYTGETYGMRSRLRQHLSAEGGPSNLRDTLFAIQLGLGALGAEVEVTLDRAASEAALTRWLVPRTVIAFKQCSYVKEVEKAVLERAASPLNIRERDTTPHSQTLKELRQRFRSFTEGHWPRIKPRLPIRR